MKPGIPVLSIEISKEHFLLSELKVTKALALTVFLIALHFFAIALPDVKSTNVTLYNLSLNKVFLYN
jgi:hypothetical protein